MKNILIAFYFLAISSIITACGGGGDESSGGNISINQAGTQAASASILLGWTTPSEKENGDPLSLSEIGGYKIYVSISNTYIPSIPYVDLTDGSATSYEINNLSPGTYYIYVTTYNVDGDESPYSEPVTKSI